MTENGPILHNSFVSLWMILSDYIRLNFYYNQSSFDVDFYTRKFNVFMSMDDCMIVKL